MNLQGPPPDDAAQAFLDTALDRLLRAWADGQEVALATLAAARPDLRAELEALVAIARETAVVQPHPLPQVPGYEVLHEAGRGGMGIVYAARQRGLDRVVALKVLPEFVAGSERARRRFLAEARNLAKVRHPHVVSIVDVFEVGPVCAYAMEWIDGKTLADLLQELGPRRRGPALPGVAFGRPGSGQLPRDPVVWFCRLGIAIARALGEVHRCGLVHRDVKPSNILLRGDGTPLLSDFGLVRDEEASLTRSGQMVGTLAFSPPEQLTGDRERVGPRSDLFALGATLHWALTGTAPFAGETAVALCANIEARARVPLTKSGLSRDLDTIVGKCLEPRAEDRYASADAVAEDLERLLALRPIAARPIGVLPRTWRLVRRNRRTVVAVAGSGIAMLVVSVCWAWQFSNQLLASRRFEEALHAARGALLEEFHDERVGQARHGEFLPTLQFLNRTKQALIHYEQALQWVPRDHDVVRERDVVAFAERTLVRSSSANAEREGAQVEPAPPLPQHLANDARLRGLYEFLLGDVRCHESWADLDLAPGNPDPLVDAAAGQMHLAHGDSDKAYPRLVRAHGAWPDRGFLAVAVADCAVRAGDLGAAAKYLDVAERLGYADQSQTWVRAELLAAKGRVEKALALYDTVSWHTGIATQEHARLRFVQLLERRGNERDRERALEMLLQLVELEPTRTRHGQRLGKLAASWWASLPEERKEYELLLCWNNADCSPFLRRLATIVRQLPADIRESRKTATQDAPAVSTAIQRQSWSMSTLPLEFTVMTARECRLMRSVPEFVQRRAAWLMLRWRGDVGRWSAAAAPASWAFVRFGTMPSLLALGWVLFLLTPEAAAQLQWQDVTPGPGSVSARTEPCFAFDPVRGQPLLFGGGAANGQTLDDTWSWDGTSRTWTPIATAVRPSPRYQTQLVQSGANSLLLFGGRPIAGPGIQRLADTWQWNGTQWAQLTPPNNPTARCVHAMAFDSNRNVVVLFGGHTGSGALADTWEWNGTNWTQMFPTQPPTGRWEHAMVYDPIRQQTVVFGGVVPGSNWAFFNQTMVWDGVAWTRLAPLSSPTGRAVPAMSWDSERARVILYGGVQGVNFNVYLNDLWDWDGSNWLQRTPTPGPAPSSRYTVCTYDPVHRQMVLFGGHDGNTHVGDTWILEPVFPADVIDTGPGCPGVVGTPTLTATPNSLPWLGDTFVADISGLPALFPSSYMLAGFGNPATPGLFCRPGCTLRTTHEVASFLPTITGQASWSIQVPVNPALLGGSVFAQAVSFDFAAGCTDAMSNGIQITIGSR